MEKLITGYNFIFKSYKHTALFLLMFGLLLTLPILTTFFPIKNSHQKVLGANTQNNRLLAQIQNQLPVGAYDSAVGTPSCFVNGWAADPDSPTVSIPIHVYRDGTPGTFISAFQTDQHRDDVTAAFPQYTGSQGFSYTLPPSSGVYDGQPHQIYLYAIDPQDTNQHSFLGVKTITCAAPTTSVCVSCAAPPNGCTYTGGSCASCGTLSCTSSPTPPTSCNSNSDCQQGFTCQAVGGTNAIGGSLIKQCVQGTGATPIPNNGTGVGVEFSLVGIGINNGGQNNNPQHPIRSVTLKLYDSQNGIVQAASGSATYQSSTGLYVGAIPVNVPDGVYTGTVRVNNTLYKKIPGIITITNGQTAQTPPVQLIPGDFNGDNEINLQDYNMLISASKQ